MFLEYAAPIALMFLEFDLHQQTLNYHTNGLVSLEYYDTLFVQCGQTLDLNKLLIQIEVIYEIHK